MRLGDHRMHMAAHCQADSDTVGHSARGPAIPRETRTRHDSPSLWSESDSESLRIRKRSRRPGTREPVDDSATLAVRRARSDSDADSDVESRSGSPPQAALGTLAGTRPPSLEASRVPGLRRRRHWRPAGGKMTRTGVCRVGCMRGVETRGFWFRMDG